MTDQDGLLDERIVIGAAMAAPDVADQLAQVIKADDFGDRRHQVIWSAITAVRERGEPAAYPAVAEQLGEMLTRVGGVAYLHSCSQVLPTGDVATFHARRVADAAHARRQRQHVTRHQQILKIADSEARARQLADLGAEMLAEVDRVPGASSQYDTSDGSDTRARRLVLTPASDIEPEPVVWAWEEASPNGGRIPLGSLSVAAGREGTGKSSFGIWLAAHITQGTLPGSLYGKPRAVIYAAVEDSWKYTLVPRLIAAGANLSMVFRVEVVEDELDGVTLSLPTDNILLEREMKRVRAALLILDPLMSTIGAGIDTHRERDVRTALDPLARLADRARCVVLGIAHFNKGAGTDPSSLITGSGAFKNVPRSVFGFAIDAEGGRVMSQTKNSLGRLDLPSLSYQIEGADIPTKSGVAHVGQLVWLGESDRSVTEILGERSDGEDHEDRKDAAAWLRSYLADNGGEAEAVDVLKAGEKVGFSKDALKRAKKGLPPVVSRKEAMDAGWMWVIDIAEGSAKGAKGVGS